MANTVGGADLLGGARNCGCLLLLIVADDGYDLRHGQLRQRRLCQWHLRVPRGLAGFGVSILRRKSQTDGADGKHPRRYRELHGGRKVFLANREQPKLHDTDARRAIRNGMRLGSYVHLRR